MRNIKLRWSSSVPQAVVVGIIAVMVMYASVAGIVTVSRDMVGGSDAKQHLDYIWRMHDGEIPKRSEGIQYPAFVGMYDGEFKPQAASANPPLFYMIHAPVVGPILDEGEYRKAAAVGKAINILLGLIGVAVLAYAGWVYGGRNKELMAVAVPAIGSLVFWYTLLNLVYGGVDSLLIIFATLSMILMYKLIKLGPKPKYVVSLAIVCALGMLTKAPFIIFFALSFAALGYSLFKNITLRKAWVNRRATMSKLLVLVGVGAFILLASVWFYYAWNYSAHGSWFTAREPGYTGGREIKSFADVIMSRDLWSLWIYHYSLDASISLALVVGAIGGIVARPAVVLKRKFKRRDDLIVAAVVVLSMLGVFATQLEHAVGIGAYYFRYFLPAIFSFSLVLAYGLLGYHNLRGQAVVFFAVLLGGSTIWARSGGNFERLVRNAERIGVEEWIPWTMLYLFVLAAATLAVSMFILTRKQRVD